MEVVRLNATASHSGAVSGKRHVIKPRSHSDMEADLPDRNRKLDFPSGSKTPTLSRFGLKKFQKGSVPSLSVTNIISKQLKSSKNNGSVIHMPLPPTPVSMEMIKSPSRSIQSRGKSSDPQIPIDHLHSPPQQHHHHHQQHHHHHRFPRRPSSATGNPPVSLSTNFSRLIGLAPPTVPDGFLRPTNTFGKVKVILKISPLDLGQQSCLNVDSFKRHVILVDLASSSLSSGVVSALQRPPHAPKTFLYDGVITETEPQMNSCMAALPEAIHAVVGGLDGCVMSYGHARLGKTFSMIGSDESTTTIGLIPTAITWLFRLIGDRRKQTGIRYSVRVSAMEVFGRQEEMRDLLADGGGHVVLKDDPNNGTQLENLCELKAPTAEQACHYLDRAISGSYSEKRETRKNCHFIFILHIYQTSMSSNPGEEPSTTYSRLYLVDFGSCSKSTREGTTLSLSALGMLILALLNGQRHVPYRDSRLAQILKSAIGSSGCHSTVLVHVTGNPYLYSDTLQILQLTSRMNKLKIRKRSKAISSASSDDANNPRAYKHRKGVKMGTLREANIFYSSGCEGGIYSSGSSEVSGDTAVFGGFESDSRCSFSARSGPPSASGSCVTLDPVFESCYETLQRFGGSTSGVSKLHHHRHHYHGISNRSAPSSTVSAPAYSQRRTQADRPTAEESRYHRLHRRAFREIPFSPSKELWIDGPNADYQIYKEVNQHPMSNSNVSIGNVTSNLKALVGPSRYEQWVDGPLEFQTLTRANVANISMQKISYSKIVKVASLKDSGDLIEEDVKPSDLNVAMRSGEYNLFGKMVPLHQSTPNSTLNKKTLKQLSQDPIKIQFKHENHPADVKCLQERLTNELSEGMEKNLSNRMIPESLDHPRGQGDGKEVIQAPAEINSSHKSSPTIYFGITMCSTDDLNLSLISSLENTKYDDEDGVDMLTTNRESIYELQMDKDLEFASGTESLRKLACLSDDEGNSLWTVSSETSLSNNKMPSERSRLFKKNESISLDGAGHVGQEFTDSATVWMEQDFTVETFYVPAGMKPTNTTVHPSVTHRSPLPLANNHSTVELLQRFSRVVDSQIVETFETSADVTRKIGNNGKIKISKDHRISYDDDHHHHHHHKDFMSSTTTMVTSPSQFDENIRFIDNDKSINNNNNIIIYNNNESKSNNYKMESNPRMIQSTHSQVPKHARISKVPKLQSLSPKKSQNESPNLKATKIPLSPSTHPTTQPASHPSIHPNNSINQCSIPISPSTSKISNSASFSSIATTSGTASDSGAVDSSDRSSMESSNKTAKDPADKNKTHRSGQSFLQKLRTPLFFRCKNSDSKSESSPKKCKIPTAPTSPLKDDKVGKLVSKVKLISKDGKSCKSSSSNDISQKLRKDDIKLISNSSNCLKSKLKPIHFIKSQESTYETKLSPIEQSFHPITVGYQMSRPNSGKFDLHPKLRPPNQNIQTSVPSPVIDRNYHNSVMQLMSLHVNEVMDTSSGNSQTKIACDENSITTEAMCNFDSGSVFEESPTDAMKRFSKKERSQSEPNHIREYPVLPIPRDTKSDDLLSGLKVKRSQNLKTGKQNKMASIEADESRLKEQNARALKSQLSSLNDAFIGRSKTTNCFEVTCLTKKK